jgi:hypothetical protein
LLDAIEDRKGRCVLETVVARLRRAYAGGSADLILLRAREERQWLVGYVAKEISAVVVLGGLDEKPRVAHGLVIDGLIGKTEQGDVRVRSVEL